MAHLDKQHLLWGLFGEAYFLMNSIFHALSLESLPLHLCVIYLVLILPITKKALDCHLFVEQHASPGSQIQLDLSLLCVPCYDALLVLKEVYKKGLENNNQCIFNKSEHIIKPRNKKVWVWKLIWPSKYGTQWWKLCKHSRLKTARCIWKLQEELIL